MTIDYEQLLVAELNDVPIDYDEQKTILYALGIGLGRDIGDRRELDYVYERHGPRTVPSFATMLVPDDLLERSGFDIGQMLHRTQSIELYRPLPSAGAFLLNQKVLGIFDHGTENGAEVEIESELRRRRDDVVVCTLGSRLILRGDGGFN